jgi:tetratricopeptide (TPR) repeat protein
MRGKYFILSWIFVLNCTLGYAQNPKLSIKDSLYIVKCYTEGLKAGRLGDFEEALSNFEKVYGLREKVYGLNSFKLAPPLINIGIQYKNLGNLDKAIESYKKAELLYVNNFGNEYSELGAVYINLGNIYKLKGDYNKALDYQKNAFRILRKDSAKYISNFQDSKYNIAEIQLKLGFNAEAIRFTQTNLRTISPPLRPLMYDLIALAYRNEGMPDLSERNYLLAIKSWIDLYGDDNVELASEYLAYSSFLISQKDYEKALIYSGKAKSIALKYFGEKSTSYAEDH